MMAQSSMGRSRLSKDDIAGHSDVSRSPLVLVLVLVTKLMTKRFHERKSQPYKRCNGSEDLQHDLCYVPFSRDLA